MTAPRIPSNLFGIPYGLAGLAGSWNVAAHGGSVPQAVADGLLVLAAAVWLLTVVCYLLYAASARGGLTADLTDATAAPFVSLAVIAPVLLAAGGLVPRAPEAGKVVVDVFIALTVLLGGWLAGQWIYGPLELDRLHPGYLLPTAAGGLVASAGAASVGQTRLAYLLLGLGIVSWLILGSMIMGRLLFRPRLPDALLPTLAIELAPAPVASIAYFSINGGRIDAFAAGLAGYGVLMVLAQMRLLPLFVRLPFVPGTWAFAFAWAAVGTATLYWINAQRPAGHHIYTYLVLAAVTALISAIAARTVLALVRHQLIPAPAPPAQSPTAR